MRWSKACLDDIADLCLGKMLDQNKNKGELLTYDYIDVGSIRTTETDAPVSYGGISGGSPPPP